MGSFIGHSEPLQPFMFHLPSGPTIAYLVRRGVAHRSNVSCGVEGTTFIAAISAPGVGLHRHGRAAPATARRLHERVAPAKKPIAKAVSVNIADCAIHSSSWAQEELRANNDCERLYSCSEAKFIYIRFPSCKRHEKLYVVLGLCLSEFCPLVRDSSAADPYYINYWLL